MGFHLKSEIQTLLTALLPAICGEEVVEGTSHDDGNLVIVVVHIPFGPRVVLPWQLAVLMSVGPGLHVSWMIHENSHFLRCKGWPKNKMKCPTLNSEKKDTLCFKGFMIALIDIVAV